MGKTKIRMDLSVESIQSAINQLERYKITFMRKVEVLTERLAEYGNSIALEKNCRVTNRKNSSFEKRKKL